MGRRGAAVLNAGAGNGAPARDDGHELEIVLRSRIPLVNIETREETRVMDLCRRLVIPLGKPLFKWSVTEGLHRLDLDLEVQRHNAQPEEMLRQIKATTRPGIYLLLDFHPYIDDPLHVRLLKEIAQAYATLGHTIVFVGHTLDMPAELRHLTARFELALPGPAELEQLIRDLANEWSAQNHAKKVKTDRATLDRIIRHLGGLTLGDARRLARRIIWNDGALSAADLEHLARAKYELLAHGGVLSYEYDVGDFSAVAGLATLKRWLQQRTGAFQGDPALGALDRPRGILLTGVQGCGKSLAAKAVAGLWGIPLLRMDFGALYNKFHGETERNLRESLRAAEAMAPCVLWIDEIEKGIAADAHDGGTSRRVLGTLLSWMAERRTAVFIVATANDIEHLPPELVRKGRFDEIFFVDLPGPEARARIFEIHLSRRGRNAAEFDLARLAAASDGFSGSEIEQAVVAALYSAHAGGLSMDTALVESELAATRPLSVVMEERVARLRAWAAGRTVAAD